MNLVDRGYFLLTRAHKLTVYFFSCSILWIRQATHNPKTQPVSYVSFHFYDCTPFLYSVNLPSFLPLFFSSSSLPWDLR